MARKGAPGGDRWRRPTGGGQCCSGAPQVQRDVGEEEGARRVGSPNKPSRKMTIATAATAATTIAACAESTRLGELELEAPRSQSQRPKRATKCSGKVTVAAAAARKRLLLGVCVASVAVAVVAALQQLASCQETATAAAAASERPPDEPLGAHDFTAPLQNTSAASGQPSKLRPVNFTLVNELFESVLDDDEVARRWRNMDAQFQEGIRSILKLVFPQIVAISQDAKVSGDCSGGILKWILSLRNMRSWALKMLDATGKPTAGIFEGSLTMFGNYRQCLSVRAPDEDEIEVTDQFEEYFRGQFCVLHLRPYMPAKRPFYNLNTTLEMLLRKNYKYYEKTFYDELAEIAVAFNFIDVRMDLCVPSTCSIADIQRVAELLSKQLEMKAKVMRCDIRTRSTLGFFQSLDQVTFNWILAPLVQVALVLVCTLLITLGLVKRQRRGDASESDAARGSLASLGRLLVNSLSINQAVRNRLSTGRTSAAAASQSCRQCDEASGRPAETRPTGRGSCREQVGAELALRSLYGLRSVFVVWFIIVQMTVELKYQYLRESLVLREMLLSYWPFQIIINTSLLFESLILITAFAFGYSNVNKTLKQLVATIVDTYFRLAPSIVALIALTIATPLLSLESPVWKNFVDSQANVCKSTGYLNVFFLQNFISYDKICLPHTWLFCVQVQLILLSIPIMILLRKTFSSCESSTGFHKSLDSSLVDAFNNKREAADSCANNKSQFQVALAHLLKSRAGLLGFLLVFVGFLANFLLVYSNQLPPAWFNTYPDPQQKSHYFGLYLAKPWAHLSAFVIGLYAGYLCRLAARLASLSAASGADGYLATTTAAAMQLNELLGTRKSASERDAKALPAQSSSKSDLTTSTDCLSQQNSRSGSLATIMVLDARQVAPDETTSSGGQSTPTTTTTSTRSRRLRTRALLSALLQASAFACMAALIFSTYSWSTGELPAPLVAASYDALSRLVWSLALVCVMVQLCKADNNCAACEPHKRRREQREAICKVPCHQARKGACQQSKPAELLSKPICIVLGRLSFLAYLISPYVHTFVLAVEEQSLFPSLFLIFHVILGNIVITYSIAFVFSIVIEQPVRQLARCATSWQRDCFR